MNRSVRTTLLASAVAAALVTGAGAPALAAESTATPRTLAAIQAAAKASISKRTDALNSGIARAKAAQGLPDDDRATIVGILSSDVSGLSDLGATIAADTDAKTAAADSRKIFTQFRVFAVALPQSRIAGAADRLTGTAIPKLTAEEKRLAEDLAGKHASKSTPALVAKLVDMRKNIAAASAALSGVADSALAVTPADYNSNHSVLTPLRASVATAAKDLKQARADGAAVRKALRG